METEQFVGKVDVTIGNVFPVKSVFLQQVMSVHARKGSVLTRKQTYVWILTNARLIMNVIRSQLVPTQKAAILASVIRATMEMADTGVEKVTAQKTCVPKMNNVSHRQGLPVAVTMGMKGTRAALVLIPMNVQLTYVTKMPTALTPTVVSSAIVEKAFSEMASHHVT